MAMKKCPNCGLPVAGMQVCPVCGTRIPYGNEQKSGDTQFFSGAKQKAKSAMPNEKIRLGAWDVAFIILCNVSLVCSLINLIMGGICWCHYPVCLSFSAYFIAFACASGSLKKFLTRYRNAVLVLNIIYGLFNLVCNAAGQGNLSWAFDYFIPVNLLVANTVILCLIPCQSVPGRNITITAVMLLSQSVLQFVLMAIGLTAIDKLPRILVSCAFGVNLITSINLIFLYFVKYRNVVVEKFRLWE